MKWQIFLAYLFSSARQLDEIDSDGDGGGGGNGVHVYIWQKLRPNYEFSKWNNFSLQSIHSHRRVYCVAVAATETTLTAAVVGPTIIKRSKIKQPA